MPNTSFELDVVRDLLRRSNGKLKRKVLRGSCIMIAGCRFYVPQELVGKTLNVRQESPGQAPNVGLYLDIHANNSAGITVDHHRDPKATEGVAFAVRVNDVLFPGIYLNALQRAFVSGSESIDGEVSSCRFLAFAT